jgi:hypothetical protein
MLQQQNLCSRPDWSQTMKKILPFALLLLPIVIGLSVYYTDFYSPDITETSSKISESKDDLITPQVRAVEAKLDAIATPENSIEVEQAISDANKLLLEAEEINQTLIVFSEEHTEEQALKDKLSELKQRTDALNKVID